MNPQRDMLEAYVPWSDLWAEVLGLVSAFLLPLILLLFDLADRRPDLFHRGGTVALVIIALLEFKNLSELTRKHLNNALRIKDGEQILNVSKNRRTLSWVALVGAFYATAVSAFGDKFVTALVKLQCHI